MKSAFLCAVVRTSGLYMSGCANDEPSEPVVTTQPASRAPVSQPIPVSPMPELPAIDTSPYAGPVASVSVTHMESHPVQHAASVEITVPSGGWTLARDHAAVIDGVAKLFYTLEKPAADEMVTQALQTLQDRFVSTDPAFAGAEVYVHLAERGVSTLTTNYRLAAHE